MTASPTYGELTNKGASTNIAWHEASVGRDERSKQRGHRSAILWFTGLSGSGKSTLANAVNAALFERGLATYVLMATTSATASAKTWASPMPTVRRTSAASVKWPSCSWMRA